MQPSYSFVCVSLRFASVGDERSGQLCVAWIPIIYQAVRGSRYPVDVEGLFLSEMERLVKLYSIFIRKYIGAIRVAVHVEYYGSY